MNLKIKYYDINNNLVYKYKVLIYNSQNELIYINNTDNGYIYFSSKDYDLYKIIFISHNAYTPKKFNTYFYFHKLIDNTLPIHINNFKISNSPIIKIVLTDIYYSKLKIERGKIILWQKNMI